MRRDEGQAWLLQRRSLRRTLYIFNAPQKPHAVVWHGLHGMTKVIRDVRVPAHVGRLVEQPPAHLGSWDGEAHGSLGSGLSMRLPLHLRLGRAPHYDVPGLLVDVHHLNGVRFLHVPLVEHDAPQLRSELHDSELLGTPCRFVRVQLEALHLVQRRVKRLPLGLLLVPSALLPNLDGRKG